MNTDGDGEWLVGWLVESVLYLSHLVIEFATVLGQLTIKIILNLKV